MKRKLGAMVLTLCIVLAGCNDKNIWHNTTVEYPSPNKANGIITLTLNIPPDVELTTASDDKLETLIYRNNSIIGNIACDKVEVSSDQNSTTEIYKRIINSENTDWSLDENLNRVKVKELQQEGIIISTLKNIDSDIGILIYIQELDTYIGIKILGDAFTSEEADMLIASIYINLL